MSIRDEGNRNTWVQLYQEATSFSALRYAIAYQQLKLAMGEDAPLELLKALTPAVAQEGAEEAGAMFRELLAERREQMELALAQQQLQHLEQLKSESLGVRSMPSPW